MSSCLADSVRRHDHCRRFDVPEYRSRAVFRRALCRALACSGLYCGTHLRHLYMKRLVSIPKLWAGTTPSATPGQF